MAAHDGHAGAGQGVTQRPTPESGGQDTRRQLGSLLRGALKPAQRVRFAATKRGRYTPVISSASTGPKYRLSKLFGTQSEKAK